MPTSKVKGNNADGISNKNKRKSRKGHIQEALTAKGTNEPDYHGL